MTFPDYDPDTAPWWFWPIEYNHGAGEWVLTIWLDGAIALAAVMVVVNAWWCAREDARPALARAQDEDEDEREIEDDQKKIGRFLGTVVVGPLFWPVLVAVAAALAVWALLLALFARPAARAYQRSPQSLRDRCTATAAELEALAATADDTDALLSRTAATLREVAADV